MIIDLENKIKQIKYDPGLNQGIADIKPDNLSWQKANGEIAPHEVIRNDLFRNENEGLLDSVMPSPAPADIDILSSAALVEPSKQPFLNSEEKRKLDELRGKISPEDKTNSEVDAFWDPEKQPVLKPSLNIDESQNSSPRMTLDDALNNPSLSDVKEQLGGLKKDTQQVEEEAESEQPIKNESIPDTSQNPDLEKEKIENKGEERQEVKSEEKPEDKPEANSQKSTSKEQVSKNSKIDDFAKKVAEGIVEITQIPDDLRSGVEESLKNGVLKGIYEIASLPVNIAQKVRELIGQNVPEKASQVSSQNNSKGSGGTDPERQEKTSSGNEIKDILNSTKVTEMKDGTFENDLDGLRKRIVGTESFKDLPLPVRASMEARMKFQAEYFNQQKNVDNIKTAEAQAETNLEKWKTFQNQAKLLAKRVGYLLPAAIIAFSGLPFSAIYLPLLGTAAGGLLYGRMNINDKELSLEILKSKRKAEESKSKLIEIKAQRQNRSDSALTSYIKTMALVSANQRGEDQETAIKNAMNSTGIGILPLVK